MTARLTLDLTPPIAHVNLTSADGENRIGAETIADLRTACSALLDEPELRAVLLTASGSAFSLGWTAALLAETGARLDGGELPGDPFGMLTELPLPVIAVIDGDAVSAGLELALACDLRVASPAARFVLPETEFGLLPLAGGTQRLPRLIGRSRALQLVLLGEQIGAETALAWGLLNALAADPLAEAGRLASVIATRGPVAERFAKEAVKVGSELPLARALRYELDLTVLLQTTSDRAEGVRAFVEKRVPHFTGN